MSISRRGFLWGAMGGLASGILGGCDEKEGARSGPFAAVEGASSAERAVEGARRFAGTSLKVGSERGPQAEELLRYSGPEWERLTGISVHVVELGLPSEQFHRILAEHAAKTGALDCASVAPAWMPDLLAAGALEPLDEYVKHYMMPSDLDDYLPLYRSLGVWEGHRYGLFDDGDVLLLYYRRDLFEDERNRRDFEAKYGRPLGDPRTYDWRQFVDAARFFTERGSGRGLYGMAPLQREQEWAWFELLLRLNGGEFFDSATMRATVNAGPGRRAMEQLVELKQFMPPMGSADVPNTTTLASYLSGGAAMASFWPPLGCLAEGYRQEDLVRVLPRTQVAGKTGYALLPGGRTEAAVGFMLGVMSRSRHKEAAYLFAQWLNSPEISLKRVMLPYSMRDPYRRSHVESPLYRSAWPSAGEYLDTLRAAASGSAMLDLCVLGSTEYEEAFYHAATDLRLGGPIEAVANQLASRWDEITEQYGRSRQRAAYLQSVQRQKAVMELEGVAGRPEGT